MTGKPVEVKSRVIGIDGVDMVHIDITINFYCESNRLELISATFFESDGHKYMLLIAKDKMEGEDHVE